MEDESRQISASSGTDLYEARNMKHEWAYDLVGVVLIVGIMVWALA